jgi:hypothetical protein
VPRSKSENKKNTEGSPISQKPEFKPTVMPIKLKKKLPASRNLINKSMIVNDEFIKKIQSLEESKKLKNSD